MQKHVTGNLFREWMNNRTSCETLSSHEEAVGGGEGGSWQLGANASKWAVVNSRNQVRTGCYQTFKAESISLLLRQGEKRRCYQNLKALLIFCKVFIRVHWLKAESHVTFAGLRRTWGILPSLHLSSALCIPQLGFWQETTLRVLQMQWANTEWLQRMLLPPWGSWCTHAHHIGDGAGQSLQCLVLSTFLWCQLIFSLFLKCALCLLSHGKYVYLSLHVWMCEHAYVWFHWDLRKHCW